jgi:hypothetical protein
LPSDYDHSILQSHNANVEQSRSGSASGKTIAQLGEQKNQSLPPLNVFSDDDPEMARLVAQMATHLDTGVNYTGNKDFPMDELAYKYKYGKPLVRREQTPHLLTEM